MLDDLIQTQVDDRAATPGKSNSGLTQDLPVRLREHAGDESTIEIQDDPDTLGLSIDYVVQIQIPLITNVAYRKEFRHTAVFENR